MLFQPLVLGGLNGILSPVVTGAHQLLTDRTLDMRRYQRQKDDLERESLARNPSTAYYVSDEEFDRQIGELRWSPEDLNAMENMYEERASFSLRSLCVSAFRWLLEQLFEIASVIVDIIRTFYLIVLSILGPLVFAVSVFDGFRDSLVHWFAKYVSVYLWLPVADIFGAVLARIQTLSLQQDMDRMLVDPFYFVDSNNSIYILFMVVGIIGYFTIPSGFRLRSLQPQTQRRRHESQEPRYGNRRIRMGQDGSSVEIHDGQAPVRRLPKILNLWNSKV